MQEADPVELCDVTCGRYIRLACGRSHPILSQRLVQARIRIKDMDKGFIRLACITISIPFSANSSSEHGVPHPADPPLVPRQPHHPTHPAHVDLSKEAQHQHEEEKKKSEES